MIRIDNWPNEINKDEKAKKIITKHMNHVILERLFLPVVDIINSPTNGEIEKASLESFYKKTSITNGTCEKAQSNIESLLEKIDDDSLKELTIEEKYAFFQLLFPMIEAQERDISKMYDEHGTEGIKYILNLYKIQDEDDRNYIIDKIKKNRNLKKSQIRKSLSHKSNRYVTSVSNAVDDYNAFIFEYPAMPSTLFFSEQEYIMLTLLEQEKEMRKEEGFND